MIVQKVINNNSIITKILKVIVIKKKILIKFMIRLIK